MQFKKMPSVQSSSPQLSGPLKTKLKPAKLDFKSTVALSLLIFSLITGGLYASKKMFSESHLAKVTSVNKAELVKSVLALSDDDYHDEKIPDTRADLLNHYDHQGNTVSTSPVADRFVAAASHEAIHQDAVLVETTSVAGPDLAALQEEERLNAERSEANSLQTSSTIESQYVALSQAAEEKRIRARDAIRIEREKQKQMILSQAEASVQMQIGLFDGVLTKCRIPGHDVHWISHQGHILKHELVHAPLMGNALAARDWINKLGPNTVVMVYKKGYEVYDGNGNLIETGNKE